MKRIICGLAGAVVLSACGGPGKVDGKVAGISMDVADAIFMVRKNSDGAALSLITYLSDQEDLCTAFKANRLAKNSTLMALETAWYRNDGTPLAPEAGEYSVIDGNPTAGSKAAWADFLRFDGNCTNTISSGSGIGRSGLVTIKKFDSQKSAAGTFDITFGSGDKVTGNFSADWCDLSKTPSDLNCE